MAEKPTYEQLEQWVKQLEEEGFRRKLAEKALIESEIKHKTLVNNIPGMIYRAYPDWSAEVISGCEKISGYTTDELNSEDKNWLSIIHPDDLERVFSEGSVLSTRQKDLTQTYRIKAKNGDFRWVEDRKTSLFTEEGEFIGIDGVVFDITDRIKSEKALRESEKKYKDLAELLPQLVYELDDKGFFTFVNLAGIAMSGYTQEDFDNGISGLEIMHDESVDRFTQDIIRVLNGERLTGRNYMLKRKDETVIPITTYSIPIEQDGKVIGIRGVGIDISKHVEAEDALRKTIVGTIRAMAYTVEIRDPYTSGHQQRVASLATAIAEEMGFSEEQIEGVRMAAMIHDIGKIAVPAEILSKPGIISKIEFDMIKTHAKTGYEILERIEFPWPIAKIVHQHHERINGTGYPSGLSGNDILMEAKILGVADVVESMVSHRPYRPGPGIEKALEEILENRNILYSPEVVDACLKVFRENYFSFD